MDFSIYKHDVKGIDLRIGVLNHTVTQHKFKEKKVKSNREGEGIENLGNYDELEDDE